MTGLVSEPMTNAVKAPLTAQSLRTQASQNNLWINPFSWIADSLVFAAADFPEVSTHDVELPQKDSWAAEIAPRFGMDFRVTARLAIVNCDVRMAPRFGFAERIDAIAGDAHRTR